MLLVEGSQFNFNLQLEHGGKAENMARYTTIMAVSHRLT